MGAAGDRRAIRPALVLGLLAVLALTAHLVASQWTVAPRPVAGSAYHGMAARPVRADDEEVKRRVRLNGRVVDDRGEPVVDACVRFGPLGRGGLVSPDGELDSEALTVLGDRRWRGFGVEQLASRPAVAVDQEGRFELVVDTSHGGPDRAWYLDGGPEDDLLLVLAPGWAPRVDQLDLTEDEVDLGDLRLVPTARVVGRLVDADGRPRAGAVLPWRRRQTAEREPHDRYRWLAPAAEGSLTTAEDGRFDLGPQWPGRFVLSVDLPGRLRFEQDAEVAAGELADLGDLQLDAGRALVGVVRDGDGAPLAGVSVQVVTQRPTSMPGFLMGDVGMGGGGPLPEGGDTIHRELGLLSEARGYRWTNSADDGRFRLDAVLDQPHVLYVSRAGFEPLRLPDVSPGEVPPLVLLPSAELLVHVVDGRTGEPVLLPSDVVLARRRLVRDGPRPPDRELAVLGSGREDDVPEGTLRIPSAGSLGTELRLRRPVDGYGEGAWVAPGLAAGERRLVRWELQPAATLEVVVVDGAGEPQAGAQVVLREEGWQAWKHQAPAVLLSLRSLSEAPPAHEGRTDPEGRLTFDGLGRGPYQLEVKYGLEPDASPMARLLAMSQEPGHAEELTFEPGERRRVTAILPRTTVVTGTLVDDAGRPLPAGRLRLEQRDPATGTWDQVGRFEKRDDGSFEVSAVPAGPARVVSRLGVHAFVAGRDDPLRLVRPAPPTLRGRVSCGGEAVLDGRVELQLLSLPDGTAHAERPLRVEVDGQGRYSCELPAAGTWAVWWDADGDPGWSMVEVAWGATVNHDLALPTGGLRVRLVDGRTGAPISAGAQVMLLDDEQRIHVWEQPDDEGWLEFPFVRDGRYTPHVSPFGDHPACAKHLREPIEVRGGRWLGEQTWSLDAPARLELDVRAGAVDGPAVRDGTLVRVVRMVDGKPLLATPSGGVILPRREGQGPWLSRLGFAEPGFELDGTTVGGRCLADSLRPGTYRVAAGDLTAGQVAAKGLEVTLAAGETRALLIALD